MNPADMRSNASMSPTFHAPPITTEASEHVATTSSNVPVIRNVLATCNLCCILDLAELVRHVPNAEYNPRRSNAIVVRRRTPKATALIFASGKLIIMGAESEADAKLAAMKNARIIQKQGYHVRFRGFSIQNIVASAAIGAETEGIRLEMLARDYREFAFYEPELFTGLEYQMSDPKVMIKIFHTGKIILSSARTRQDLYTAFEKIVPIVRQYPLRIVPTSKTFDSKEARKPIREEDTKKIL
ncbi:MAG: hypothetical protein Q9195_002187 [Heterodermia aff. obscurata]